MEIWNCFIYFIPITILSYKFISQIILTFCILHYLKIAILQPADAYWNKPIKGEYVVDYNVWFIHGEKKLTGYGNLAGPGYEKMCNWINKGWKNLDTEVIISSFKGCGITSNKLSEFNKHLRAVLKNELSPKVNIVEKTSHFDFQDICLFADLNEEDDDEDDEDYK